MRADLSSATIAWGRVAREAVAREAEAREAEGEEEQEAVAVVAPVYTLDAFSIAPRVCYVCVAALPASLGASLGRVASFALQWWYGLGHGELTLCLRLTVPCGNTH